MALRTKVKLKQTNKARVFRKCWLEDLEHLLSQDTAEGVPRYEEIARWKTANWNKKDEDGEYVYSQDDLVTFCVDQGLLACRTGEDGNVPILPNVPANQLRFKLTDLLEQTGFDPEA